jgi:hypothetical protein
LVDGQGDVWHTIVNFVFQSDPQLWPLVDGGQDHEKVLASDGQYEAFIAKIQSALPSGQLRKWRTGPGYRERFCRSFGAALKEFKPLVSACSFQERVLRASRPGLLGSYNSRIGGIEGRGIGFEEYADAQGRRQMKHSFINFHGYHEIVAPENQMLILLLMAWFVADQYGFSFRHIVGSGRYGFEGLHMTVVSDKLSGDDDSRRKSEANLRRLVDPEGDNAPLTLTRSSASDTFSGDLLVDNLAGWLTAAMEEPTGQLAYYAQEIAPTGIWKGWHHLQPSTSELEAAPAANRLSNART